MSPRSCPQLQEELACYAEEQFQEKLGQRYAEVAEPGTRTLRVRVTLAGAKRTKQLVGTFTKFDLAGGPINAVQAIRGKEGLFTGSISYSVDVFDASSNRLIKAYVAPMQ